MVAPLCAALALVLAAPAAAAAAKPRAPAHKVTPRPAARDRRPKVTPTALEKARGQLAAVKRDPAKRRYRHHWEKAITALERAAKGGDRAPALLEAARARYALYRTSQVEEDRDRALRLAARADRAGAKEAAALARAIRKEMGEDRDEQVAAVTPARAKRGGAPAPASRRAEAGARSSVRPERSAVEPKGATATSNPTANPTATSNPTATVTANPIATATANPTATATADPLAPDTEPDPDADDEPSTDPAIAAALASASDAPATAPDAGPARVGDVKTWSNSDYTRVAVYLSRQVAFTKEVIPADAGHPRRLALDLAPAALAQGISRPVGDALVKRIRAAQRDGGSVRVVLDLAGEDALAIFSLDDPPRLIVDVGVSQARSEARASALAGEAAPRRRGVRRIVVDAGHGGHDTGAIGPTRVREKDVTLAMAKRLARRLEAKGFEVVLTRNDDTFVPLEERTAIANARRGDLFVSLHANAHPRRDRAGVETYMLNAADDRYARRLAARENGAAADDGAEAQDVRRVLTDLDVQSSAEASRRLAHAVQHEVCAGIRGRVGDVRDLGVKSALFYVLLGARMPAVLVETSFISNRTEEKRLASARFQDEVASSVTRAIEHFVAREARVASVR
ncbi:MAG: N-acetylmuramoyl-L-alanine amidase [Anaeromyxobacteraceae bacterium]